MAKPTIVQQGGIVIERDAIGNLTIRARGNGVAHVQKADVPDLQHCLDKLATTQEPPDGE